MISASLLCVAMAVYFESRGQPYEGQVAVAEVVVNRIDSPKFPNTACGVIKHDLGPAAWDCQFSFMCDGKPDVMTSQKAKAKSIAVAKSVLDNNQHTVQGAQYFLQKDLSLGWADRITRVKTIGNHTFYKE